MRQRMTVLRRSTDLLLRHMLSGVPGTDRDWALGMAAEVAAIEGDWPAFWFAFGCWWSARGVELAASIIPFCVGLYLIGWAGAKAYLGVWVLAADMDVPRWLGLVAGLSSGLYAATAASIFLKRYRIVIATMLGLLMINIIAYMTTVFGPGGNTIWLVAVIFEDYAVWSVAAFGLGLALWLGREAWERVA